MSYSPHDEEADYTKQEVEEAQAIVAQIIGSVIVILICAISALTLYLLS